LAPDALVVGDVFVQTVSNVDRLASFGSRHLLVAFFAETTNLVVGMARETSIRTGLALIGLWVESIFVFTRATELIAKSVDIAVVALGVGTFNAVDQDIIVQGDHHGVFVDFVLVPVALDAPDAVALGVAAGTPRRTLLDTLGLAVVEKRVCNDHAVGDIRADADFAAFGARGTAAVVSSVSLLLAGRAGGLVRLLVPVAAGALAGARLAPRDLRGVVVGHCVVHRAVDLGGRKAQKCQK
jgi:hypothetical protein